MSKTLSIRARHNALLRYRPADDPAVIESRQDLKEAVAADYIRRIVDEAPPLTDEQRNRLAALLRGSGAGDA